MSESKYITRNFFKEEADLETGEIKRFTEISEVVKRDSEPFFLTYSREILALYGKSIFNATTKVLWKLLEIAEYNTGEIYMTAKRRNIIMETCGISRASFDRAIRELEEADILERDGTTYSIRPDMFWKGDRKERNKLLTAKLKISFSAVYADEE